MRSKTGQQIIVERMTTEVGQRATTEVRTLTFGDEAVLPKLQQLATAFPGAAVYLSGTLTVDLADEMTVGSAPNQLQSLVVSGATVTLNHHPLERAIGEMGAQYGVGTVTAKVISPLLQLGEEYRRN
jgi:inner membrane protein